MSYGPGQGLPAPKNRHLWNEVSAHDTLRWNPPTTNARKCQHCGIIQVGWPGEPKRWRDRSGTWHEGGAPKCQRLT